MTIVSEGLIAHLPGEQGTGNNDPGTATISMRKVQGDGMILEVGGRIPLASAARERFAAASARGLGQLDCAALIEEFLPTPTEPTDE